MQLKCKPLSPDQFLFSLLSLVPKELSPGLKKINWKIRTRLNSLIWSWMVTLTLPWMRVALRVILEEDPRRKI